MSELIVDLFEVIAVDVGKAESHPLALVARDLGRQRFLKSLAVASSRQGIDTRRESLLLVDRSQHSAQHDHDYVL